MSATTNIMKHTTNELSGGYILLPTYDDSLPVDPADDETPVMYFAVSIKGIKDFVRGDDLAAAHWLSEFTYDDSQQLLGFAALNGEVAFEYHPCCDSQFENINIIGPDRLSAFIDFVSGKFQEEGQSRASACLDDMFNF